MAKININESLKSNLKSIQNFNDEQINFFRDEESEYYHSILDIINFIRNNELDILNTLFYSNKDYIKDFKELFELLNGNEHYYDESSKKTNFHKTIENLNKIITDYKKTKKEEISTLKNTLQEYDKKFKTMEESLKSYQETSSLLHKDFKDKNNQIDAIAKKAKNIETSFTEHHKIFETKKYWQEKATKHFWTSAISFLLFLALVGTITYTVNLKIEATKQADINKAPMQVLTTKDASTLVKAPQLIEYEKTLEKHMIIRYIQYLFLLSLILWIARILLKITFSNLHLREEAHEKETMIMTYLALINDGGGLKDNDRQLILEAIFRPSTNGLIKDETNVTLLDIIKGLKK